LLVNRWQQPFAAVGVVAVIGASTVLVYAFAVIAFVAATLLALIAWGVLHSTRLTAAGSLDPSLQRTIATATMCACGHDHDVSEMHVTDTEAQAHDSYDPGCQAAGSPGCAGPNSAGCDTCALATARPERQRD
jgi:hypothetical protein